MFPPFVQEMVDQFTHNQHQAELSGLRGVFGSPNLLELFAALKKINYPCALMGRHLVMCVDKDDFSREDMVWALKLEDQVFSETGIQGWDKIAKSYVRNNLGHGAWRWQGEESDLGARMPSVGRRQLELVEVGKALQARTQKEVIMSKLPIDFKSAAKKAF